MKVTKLETLEIELPGQQGLVSWRPIFARNTDEGITGVSEVGLTFGIAGVGAATMILDLGKRLVLGKDPND